MTSLTRSPAIPEVAPLAELGIPGYEANNWYSIIAPAGLPAAIAEKIHADTAKILQAQEIKNRFNAVGMEARSMPPAELAAYIKSEIAKWGKVVKASGARPE